MKCIVCGIEFKSRNCRNTLCSAACKIEHKRNKNMQYRDSKRSNAKSELKKKVCIYCGNDFLTRNEHVTSCQSKKCSYLRSQALRKIRRKQMIEYQNSRIADGLSDVADRRASGYYDAKCPRCKRYHKYRFEYGVLSEGTIYKFCPQCKSYIADVSDDTIIFGDCNTHIMSIDELVYS